MKSFHNIEKLAGKPHYTGYAGGAIFRIRKSGANNKDRTWEAYHSTGPCNVVMFYGATLEEVSARLDDIAKRASL